MLGGTVPKTTRTSDGHFFQSLGVPKTLLKFDNLLEGLQELTESCYSHGSGVGQSKDTDENRLKEEMPG